MEARLKPRLASASMEHITASLGQCQGEVRTFVIAKGLIAWPEPTLLRNNFESRRENARDFA